MSTDFDFAETFNDEDLQIEISKWKFSSESIHKRILSLIYPRYKCYISNLSKEVQETIKELLYNDFRGCFYVHDKEYWVNFEDLLTIQIKNYHVNQITGQADNIRFRFIGEMLFINEKSEEEIENEQTIVIISKEGKHKFHINCHGTRVSCTHFIYDLSCKCFLIPERVTGILPEELHGNGGDIVKTWWGETSSDEE